MGQQSNSHGVLMFIVAGAAIVTLAIAAVVGWMAEVLTDGEEFGAAKNLAPLIAGAAILAAIAIPSRIPRVVRAAIAITIVQMLVAIGACVAWLAPQNQWAELIDLQLQAGPEIALWLSIAVLFASAVHQSSKPRRLAPTWLRPLVVFSITNLLAAGLWLPILASLVPIETVHSDVSILASPGTLALAVAVPAFIALCVALAKPERQAANCGGFMAAIVTAMLAGIALRADATEEALHLYGEFIPLLLAFAIFALGALISLAVANWRQFSFHRTDARMPAPWVQRGVVVGSNDEQNGAWIGVTRFSGWLTGFSSQVEPFRVRTTDGTLVEVPRGALLSLPLHPHCALAQAGDVVAALSVGDPVAVAGYETAAPDGAYRQNAAPIPSSQGVIVYGPGQHNAIEGFSYSLWRPCLLYLLATSAIVIPGLVGLPF